MELQDKIIKEIVSYSKLELPFSDFDQRMLQRIKEYEVRKKLAEKNRFLSQLSFLFGVILGFVLNYLVIENADLFVHSIEVRGKLTFAMQLIYVALIIVFADKLWKISKFDLKQLFKSNSTEQY